MGTWPYQREVWWDEYPERAVFVIDHELYFEERVVIVRSPDAGEDGPQLLDEAFFIVVLLLLFRGPEHCK